MNPQSLQAILIDRALGELSPEVAELLDHHLANDADARAEAARLETTIGIAGKADQHFPEPGHPALGRSAHRPALPSSWLGLAASLLVAALAAAGGYFFGSQSSARGIVSTPPARAPESATMPVVAAAPLPWTRYEVAASQGKFRFVRLPSNPSNP